MIGQRGTKLGSSRKQRNDNNVKQTQPQNYFECQPSCLITVIACCFVLGAVVQFHRFVRKFSRTWNMYCTFEACSSIVVERGAVTNFIDLFPRQQASGLIPGDTIVTSASTANDGKHKHLPNRYLIDLIRSETQGHFVQTISRVRCRVTAVQKASVRWQCKRCGEPIAGGECTNQCPSTIGYKLHAEVRWVYLRHKLYLVKRVSSTHREVVKTIVLEQDDHESQKGGGV